MVALALSWHQSPVTQQPRYKHPWYSHVPGFFVSTHPPSKGPNSMSPEVGFVLPDAIAPHIAGAVPRCVQLIGC